MSAQCLRCGIDVREYGRVGKDCRAVDNKSSTRLVEQVQPIIEAHRRREALLRGFTFVGTTAEHKRRRDEGRKR